MQNANIHNKLPREYWLHRKSLSLKISDIKGKKSSDDVGSRPSNMVKKGKK